MRKVSTWYLCTERTNRSIRSTQFDQENRFLMYNCMFYLISVWWCWWHVEPNIFVLQSSRGHMFSYSDKFLEYKRKLKLFTVLSKIWLLYTQSVLYWMCLLHIFLGLCICYCTIYHLLLLLLELWETTNKFHSNQQKVELISTSRAAKILIFTALFTVTYV